MTRFGSIASTLVARLEAEAASLPPSPTRASNPARAPTALAARGENRGQPFSQERAR